jgi:class 3 adenylate cyclase/CHASE2 domain-containing sensor protein
LVAFLIALAAALVVASPALDTFRGLSTDLLTALRWRMLGNAYPPESSAVVVVAIDEETFRTPPFNDTPGVTWTPQIAKLLTAIIEGGASVVGLDVVFPTSIEQSAAPFGEETLGARVHGFDREYLRALALGARAGKIVLGQVQHQDRPVLPSMGQRAAVGFTRNIRALNVHTDADDVVRRVPLSFEVDGENVPAMAAELVGRSMGQMSEAGSSRLPAQPEDMLTLNFQGGDDIPTYSVADLYACISKGDKDFFKRHFSGKIILIGTVLDIEDRRVTSKRFATTPEGAHAERCALAAPVVRQKFARDSIPGVYIHATAVNNLLRNEGLVELGRIGTAISALALAMLAALAALMLGPLPAALATAGLSTAWIAAATLAFRHALVLPLIEPLLSGLAALGATIGYRSVIADRGKRLLRHSFALYLAPAVIEKLLASNKPPALGGEMREVTVYFSDIAGFSSIAEKMPPTELVPAINTYFSAMAEVIERHGGFVDKYIGDAIVAVFGAPLDDPDHAANGVRAALQCAGRLAMLDYSTGMFRGTLRQRIGLNSGQALVGNIGSQRRFNYTVMGDTVNLASRLEQSNKLYGTTILAADATVALTGATFVWRELDTIRVKGRTQPVRIFEPLGTAGQVAPDLLCRTQAYAEGLKYYRARDFTRAAEQLARVAGDDPASALLLARVQQLVQQPPGPDWERISTQELK